MLISVKKAAEFLGVSPRRIRALLAQGRIRGCKFKAGFTEGMNYSCWLVEWPLDVKPGKRGPDLRRFPVREVYKQPEPLKRARQGIGIPDREKTALDGSE